MYAKWFSDVCVCACIWACLLSHFSAVWLLTTLGTVTCQAPLMHGILQARILEWVAVSCSRGSSQSRDGTRISYVYLHWQVVFTTSSTCLFLDSFPLYVIARYWIYLEYIPVLFSWSLLFIYFIHSSKVYLFHTQCVKPKLLIYTPSFSFGNHKFVLYFCEPISVLKHTF